MSVRSIKGLSLFLGVLMLSFGFLKFFHPIDGWFDTQMEMSHLPHEAILSGKVGEMVTGCLFLVPWYPNLLSFALRNRLILLACLMLIGQMCVAIYVHLQPEVPASVLPLGIRPPVIPGFVLTLTLLNAFAVLTQLRTRSMGEF